MVAGLPEPAGLDWSVPNFGTHGRHQKTLTVDVPCRPGTGALPLLNHSTGGKAEGDGEWPAMKLGPSRPRDWRKVHLGTDAETLEIRAIKTTGSRIGDADLVIAAGSREPAKVPPDLQDQNPCRDANVLSDRLGGSLKRAGRNVFPCTASGADDSGWRPESRFGWIANWWRR